MREEQVEVLVVGAGPVGLVTALLLAEAGVQVKIIDQEERTAGRSYACALHPHSLKLFHRLGLATELLHQGRRVPRLVFYDGPQRQAELDLSIAEPDFPYLLTVPQNRLEALLEQRLREKGIRVHWNHRLDAFEAQEEGIGARIEELAGTATGYIVPHWEMTVKRRVLARVQFLIGADGRHSLVRQRLGIGDERISGPEFFAVYEFDSDHQPADEVRVVLDGTTTNVLWPLPGNRFRWSFQLLHSEVSDEFPAKDRSSLRVARKETDDKIRQSLQKLAQRRAPWFTAPINELAWSTLIEFEHRLADRFGKERCWLVGDAAHQTGPVGMQSMNVGFREAEVLTSCLQRILRTEAPLEELARYEQGRQAWCRLLGLSGSLRPGKQATSWVRERAPRMLACLPAANGDLGQLANQLGLELS